MAAIDGEQTEVAIAECDAILARDRASTDVAAQRVVARALCRKVWCLVHLGLSDEAIAASEQLLQRLDVGTDPDVLIEVADLISRAGNSLLFHRRFEDKRKELRCRRVALAVAWAQAPVHRLARLSARIPSAPVQRSDPDRPRPSRSSDWLQNERIWPAAHGRARRYEQAQQLLDRLTRRLEGNEHPALVAVRARAHMNLMLADGATGRPLACIRAFQALVSLGEPAVTAFRELADTAEQRDGPDPHIAAAGALLGEITLHELHGHDNRASETAAELKKRYGGDTSLGMRALRILARPKRRSRRR
jgi:hypothetical protein